MTSIYFSISIATAAMKLSQTWRISKFYQIKLREKATNIILLIRSSPYIIKPFLHDVQNITLIHSFPLKTGKKLLPPFNKRGYSYSEIKLRL